MGSLNPTAVLKAEHETIKTALLTLDVLVRRLKTRCAVNIRDLRHLIRFFRDYADYRHHAKEEQLLFKSLARARDAKASDLCESLSVQHLLGRQFVLAMDDAVADMVRGKRGARSSFVEQAGAYSTLLKIHICDEDHVLFPLADRHLTDSQMRSLRKRFEAFDTQSEQERSLRKQQRVIQKLASAYRIGA